MNQESEYRGCLRVLCLEDSPVDAELAGEVLAGAGYELEMDVAMGRTRFEELLGSGRYDLILADFSLPDFDAHAALELAQAASPETPFICVSGTIGEEATVELLKQGADDVVLKDRLARLPLVVARAYDERARHRALIESERKLRLAQEAAALGVIDVNVASGVHSWDARTREIWGVGSDEPISLETVLAGVHPDDREELQVAMDRHLAAHSSASFVDEYRVINRLDGAQHWVTVAGTTVFEGEKPVRTVGFVRDVSEQKQAELMLRESERRFRSLFEDSPVAIWEEDHSAVKVRLEELLAEGVEDVESYLHEHPEEYERCMKLGCTLNANHAAVELFEAGSREELIARQQEIYPTDTVGGLPAFWAALLAGRRSVTHEEANLTLGGRELQVLESTSVAPGHARDWKRVFLVDVDVTERRRAERELVLSNVELELIVKAAVAALGSTTELRDPYTAGHMRRVAELACAIAAELGWEQRPLESLNTAALLHDVGKITIPAEILSRPGRLTETEMSLVRGHSAAGADIVAEIDFAGDVTNMIRQHHERLDGSGYPSGLAGDAVLPEARILAVADVIEAMISHRPYRAALPLEAAMAEIDDGAGVRYDAAACEAATRLFREQGFRFSE